MENDMSGAEVKERLLDDLWENRLFVIFYPVAAIGDFARILTK